MPIAARKYRRKVQFKSIIMASTAEEAQTLETSAPAEDSSRIEELSDSDEYEDESEEEEAVPLPAASSKIEHPPIPVLFSTPPPIRDPLETESSQMQDKTVEDCLPYLTGNPNGHELNSYGIPKLQKKLHLNYLSAMLGRYPGRFMGMDASRPWIFYWTMAAESMLGVDVSVYKDRLAYTAASCQHPDGGFGGGHGQYSHIAPSYAIVLATAMVGGGEAADIIDRKAMWHWLGKMKQADGGFTLCDGGEEDIRGAYCALVILCLLNLPLTLPTDSPAYSSDGSSTFLTGLAEWISRCQSYEGGIAASPGNEAHGGYAFCALAALCIIGAPYDVIPKHLHLPSMISWLSSRQLAPEGGFSGRTNKLVDGCYSQWVGGCWPLIEAALGGKDGRGFDFHDRLWSREGLVRYILSCNQAKKGGLRDKPGKFPDTYHTCYNLAGLNAAQHRFRYTVPSSTSTEGEQGEATTSLSAAFHWELADGQAIRPDEQRVWDDEDVVDPIDPVFLVPVGKAKELRAAFEEKVGF